MTDRPRPASSMERGLTLLTGSARPLVHWTAGAGVVVAGVACSAAVGIAMAPHSMPWLFFVASVASTLLKFTGAAIAMVAVGIFGFYFIRDNGRSARRGENSVPAKAWRGTGPRTAARIFAVGVFVLMLSFLVSLVLPAVP